VRTTLRRASGHFLVKQIGHIIRVSVRSQHHEHARLQQLKFKNDELDGSLSMQGLVGSTHRCLPSFNLVEDFKH
jgi:hypothetical protein